MQMAKRPHPKLDVELGEMVYLVEKELYTLHKDWRVYRSLFGSSEQRFNFLMSESVPLMGWLEDSLWQKVILSLSRLTDPRSMKSNDILSLEQLPPLIRDVPLSRYVRKEISHAKITCSKIREYRSSKIAHRNLDAAITPMSLPAMSRSAVTDAVHAVSAPVLTIYRELADVTLNLVPVNASQEAVQLVGLIYDGLTVEKNFDWLDNRPPWTFMTEDDA